MCGPTQMAKHEDPAENRAVFVDEFSCIGCKQCVWNASATFRMEAEHGRSRVFAQWLDNEDKIQASIGEAWDAKWDAQVRWRRLVRLS